jgi:hypothetical protein
LVNATRLNFYRSGIGQGDGGRVEAEVRVILFRLSSLGSFLSGSKASLGTAMDARDKARRLSRGGTSRQGPCAAADRTGLDCTDKYPNTIAALANVNVKTAYLDGELCGVDDAGLPSFAHTQAATDGERGVALVYYAFDLLTYRRLGHFGLVANRTQGAS